MFILKSLLRQALTKECNLRRAWIDMGNITHSSDGAF